MQWFKFGKGENVADETSAKDQSGILSLGGGGAADPVGDPARERLRRGRGRPSKVSGSGNSAGGGEGVASLSPEQQEKLAKMQEALNRLYSPSSWARVMASPFDMMLFVTGAPEFELSKEERQDLGDDASLALQFYGNVDPKLLVLLKVAGDFTSIFVTHWMMYRVRVMRERLAESSGMPGAAEKP